MDTEEVKCSGDASDACMTAEFSNTDRMRFTTMTYKIIEELRMRRDLDVENEKKIQKLLNDRFTLGWKLDQEQNQMNNQKQIHTAELRDQKRQAEERMREFKIEASQSQMYKKLVEKEKDGLKEEIRRLQLTNYAFEKKLREAERQDKLHASEREQHIQNVSVFENQYKLVHGEATKLTETLLKLEKDFEHARTLQKRLMYENSHHKCEQQIKDEEIVRLREEILALKLKSSLDPQTVAEKEKQLRAEIDLKNQHIQELEEQCEAFKKDKEGFKQQYWKTLEQLKEANRLTNTHLHTAADYRNESRKLLTEKSESQKKLGETNALLQDIQKQLADLQIVHEDAKKSWTDKVNTLEGAVESLQADVAEKWKLMDEKDRCVGEMNDTIEDLTTELESVKAILNVDKADFEGQTVLHMLDTTDCGTQIEVSLRTQDTQASVSVDHHTSQTIDPSSTSIDTQTKIAEVKDTEGQTEMIGTKDNSVQTDGTQVETCGVQTESLGKQGSECEGTSQPYGSITNETPIIEADDEIKCIDSNKLVPMKEKTKATSDDKITHGNHQNISQGGHQYKRNSRNEAPDSKARIYMPKLKEGLRAHEEELLRRHLLNMDRNDQVGIDDEINLPNAVLYKASPMSFLVQEELPNVEVGISVPKLDLHKAVYAGEQVVVEPDEFNVSLTQEESLIDKPSVPWEEERTSLNNQTERSPFKFRSHEKSLRLTSMEASSDRPVEREHGHNNTTKPHKHKLSTEEVENYFHKFEETERQFRSTSNKPLSPECSKSKLPRTSRKDLYRETPRSTTPFEDFGNSCGNNLSTLDHNSDSIEPFSARQLNGSKVNVSVSDRIAKAVDDDAFAESPKFDHRIAVPPTVVSDVAKQVSAFKHGIVDGGDENQNAPNEVYKPSEYPENVSKRFNDQRGPRSRDSLNEEPVHNNMEKRFTDIARDTKPIQRKPVVGCASFPTPVLNVSEIMQRYKETVARVKPIRSQAKHASNVVSKNAGPKCSSGTSSGDMGIDSTSASDKTPKGILKDVNDERTPRSRNVTWNEMVKNKVMD